MINLILILALALVLWAWINLYAKRKKEIMTTQKQTKEIILKRMKRI